MSTKKHPQHILAIHNSYFELHNSQHSPRLVSDFTPGLTKFPVYTFFNEAVEHVHIAQRQMLENNLAFRQLIPYITFSNVDSDGVHRFLPYSRTKHAGEAGLHGQISIGFGGHIDAKDVIYNDKSILDLQATVINAAIREANEEVTTKYTKDLVNYQLPISFTDYFILMDANNVDKVHIGIVMEATIPDASSLELIAGDDEVQLLPRMTAKELLALEQEDTGVKLENWTRLILEDIVRKKHVV